MLISRCGYKKHPIDNAFIGGKSKRAQKYAQAYFLNLLVGFYKKEEREEVGRGNWLDVENALCIIKWDATRGRAYKH